MITGSPKIAPVATMLIYSFQSVVTVTTGALVKLFLNLLQFEFLPFHLCALLAFYFQVKLKLH